MPVLVFSVGFFLVLTPAVTMFGCFVGGGDDPSTNPKGSDLGNAVPPSSQAENPLVLGYGRQAGFYWRAVV